MLSVSTGLLTKLASALISGDDNVIEKIIANKLENMGEEMLMQLVGRALPGLDIAQRVATAVETGGASEFNRLRDQWLHSLVPSTSVPGSGIARRLQNAFEKNKHLLSRPGGTKLTWVGKDWNDPNKKWVRVEDSPTGGHWKWSRSRREWLDVSARYDWRTQPRDPRGRWTEGRLRHVYVSKGNRRARRERRKLARLAARGMFKNRRR